MANRPHDQKRAKWAEQAEPEDIDEPTAPRSSGYKERQVRPSNQFNWLIRELFRWIVYFDDKFQKSTGLIDFFNTIDFGDHADWRKDLDDPDNGYEKYLEHDDPNNNGALATLGGQIVEALQYLQSDEIRPTSGWVVKARSDGGSSSGGFQLRNLVPDGGDLISIVNSVGGDPRDLLVRVLRADERIRTPKIDTENGISPIEVVQDFAADATLIARNVLNVASVEPYNQTKRIDFNATGDTGSSPGTGEPYSRTNILAYATFEWDGSSFSQIGDAVGISSINKTGTGQYEVPLDDAIPVHSPPDSIVQTEWVASGSGASGAFAPGTNAGSSWHVRGVPDDDGNGNLKLFLRSYIMDLDTPNIDLDDPNQVAHLKVAVIRPH